MWELKMDWKKRLTQENLLAYTISSCLFPCCFSFHFPLNFSVCSKVAPSAEETASTFTTKASGQPPSDATVSNPVSSAPSVKTAKSSSDSKEMKIFLSLSYIIIAYLICWSPFHFCFDALYFDENSVSYDWYSFATLCCYFNSTLNPILYACASKEFRTAFKNILLCKHCRR